MGAAEVVPAPAQVAEQAQGRTGPFFDYGQTPEGTLPTAEEAAVGAEEAAVAEAVTGAYLE